MQARNALRVMISIKERLFRIESVTRVETVLPPSVPIERGQEKAEGHGSWFGVEDAQGVPVYRRLLDNSLAEGTEVFTGEAREFRRVHTPGRQRTITIFVPEIAEGMLAIHASETDKDGRPSTAKPMFRVNMRELAAQAEKGETHHGRE